MILNKLYTLGFMEWKYIAKFIKSLTNKELKEAVMSEIILLVEAAHDVGLLAEYDYKNFCVAYNLKVNQRSAGLSMKILRILQTQYHMESNLKRTSILKLISMKDFCIKITMGLSVSSPHTTCTLSSTITCLYFLIYVNLNKAAILERKWPGAYSIT